MIRKAGVGDSIAIADFLTRHIETSMFLLGNLEAHGIGNTDHPHGTTYFLRETGDGITGIFGVANGGFLMCQLPGLTRTEAQTYAHLLKGYTLRGMTGVSDQVGLVLDALPVAKDRWKLDQSQPLYTLDLADLPDRVDRLRAPTDADRDLLETWFAGYLTDTNMSTGSGIAREAASRADTAIALGRLRLLTEDTRPVAMTDVNAQAGQAVQVGGVYTPPGLRGQRRAGRAVAAHLRELRGRGMTRAILFAASPEAATAYERIGFTRIGDYRVALLTEPLTLGDPA